MRLDFATSIFGSNISDLSKFCNAIITKDNPHLEVPIWADHCRTPPTKIQRHQGLHSFGIKSSVVLEKKIL
jgi:hypothetical protein